MIGFESFKGRREPSPGDRVFVYRNLNRKDGIWWSIKDPCGLVLGHARAVLLQDAIPYVGLGAQARIAAGAPREVHAWVRGTLATEPLDEFGILILAAVTYRPRTLPYFHFAADQSEWRGGKYAYFSQGGMRA